MWESPYALREHAFSSILPPSRLHLLRFPSLAAMPEAGVQALNTRAFVVH